MPIKTVSAILEGDDLRFIATTGSGHRLAMDSAQGGTAPRPTELLLAAQAGCTAMDVVSILRKKRQRIDRYEVYVAGEQRDEPHPRVFRQIRVIHRIEGDVTPEAARRAIKLSATKYCTVTGVIASGVAEIRHAFVLRDAAGQEHYEEVAVTGPHADPDAPAEPGEPGEPAETASAGRT